MYDIEDAICKGLITQSLLDKLEALGTTDAEIRTLYDLLKEDIKDSETCIVIPKPIDVDVVEMAMLYVLNITGKKNEKVKHIYEVLTSDPEFSFGYMFFQDYKMWSVDAKNEFHNHLTMYLDEIECDENEENVYYGLCDVFLEKDILNRIIEISDIAARKKLTIYSI